jgi:hypothetical protein
MQKCKENIHRVRIIDNMKHIYRCHITNEVCNLQGHNSIKNSTYFSFNLYQEDLNQKVDKEKKPKKKKRRHFNRYGETGKPHKIHTHTDHPVKQERFKSCRGSDLFREILESFFAFKYSHYLRHCRPERR